MENENKSKIELIEKNYNKWPIIILTILVAIGAYFILFKLNLNVKDIDNGINSDENITMKIPFKLKELDWLPVQNIPRAPKR